MGFIDWLTFGITVSRRLTNSYYIIMLIITCIAIFLMYKMKFKRFSINLWLISGAICLAWEIYLFATGSRSYNFLPAFELPYHAITEAGPGLIIMILFAHRIKLIDISDYSDDFKAPAPKIVKKPKKPTKPVDGQEESTDESDHTRDEDMVIDVLEE